MSITGPINRHFKMMLALTLALAVAAVLVATQIGVHSVAAGTDGQAPTNHQGRQTDVPPVLPPSRSSGQVWDGGAFSLNPPAEGRYSNAEMNAYAARR